MPEVIPETTFQDPISLEILRGERKELSHELLGELLEKTHLEPGSKILDFGCGSCILISGFLIPYAEKYDCYVTGSDISEVMIEFGRKNIKHERVDYICGYADGEELKGKGGFDLIVSNYVLDHIPQPESILPQLKALLKPGGKLWVMVSADHKFYEYRHALKVDPIFAKYSQEYVEPFADWVEDKSFNACENFYREHLAKSGLDIQQINTYPTLGLDFDTSAEYVEFFMWITMGATSTPKEMEPKMREFCAKHVNSWLTKSGKDLKLDWKVCGFLAQNN